MGGSGDIPSILIARRPYFEVDKDGGQPHCTWITHDLILSQWRGSIAKGEESFHEHTHTPDLMYPEVVTTPPHPDPRVPPLL